VSDGPRKVSVLDDTGYVELMDVMASDLAVVNAARVSYAKESLVMSEKDEKLVDFLMREGHGSPFEHNSFMFRVKAPLFVVRQWQRHRMASYNEHSGRWSHFQPEFYKPSADVTSQWQEYADASEESFARYRRLLDAGEPKERARMVLLLSLYTTFWFTVNARSLMNFIAQRSGETAQGEMQQYSAAIGSFLQAQMPVTHAAFLRHGRVAP
jgi:thymidylate synthase (FAD)